MKYSCKFQLTNQKNSQNYYAIRVRVSYSGNRVELRLGKSVLQDCWNPVSESAKASKASEKINCAEINRAISDFRANLDKLFAKCELVENREPSPSEIKELIRTNKLSDNPISEVSENFLKDNSHLSEGSISRFRTVVRKFIKVFGDMPVAHITSETMHDFTDRLVLEQENSGAMQYASDIVTICNYAYEKKLTSEKVHAKRRLLMLEPQVIYLESDELHRLLKTEMKLKYSVIRDMFCFCCFTGLRYSDMQKLRWADVYENHIDIITKKTTDRLRIELNKYSKKILERQPRILATIFPKTDHVTFGRLLQKVCQMAGIDEEITVSKCQGRDIISETGPKWKYITSHVGRKTFVVQALTLGISLDVIMKWTGHKNLESIKPYVKIVNKLKEQNMKKFDDF